MLGYIKAGISISEHNFFRYIISQNFCVGRWIYRQITRCVAYSNILANALYSGALCR